MQVASVINIASSSPAAAVSNPAQGGAVDHKVSALSTNGAPNTGSLADALITQAGVIPAQFAGLLAGQNNKGVSVDDNQQDNADGKIAALQTSGIAIPPLGLYIDQQPNKNIVLTQNDIVTDATAGKKLVYDNTSLTPVPISSRQLAEPAPEIYNNDTGKIKLANLDTQLQDADFHKAFANIIEQAKDKTATNQQVHIQAKVVDAQVADANSKTLVANKAVGADTISQPQQIAGKIAAKVIGVKEDKINLDTDTSPEMIAKLQDLDAQLRARNYTQIKAVAGTLQQSPIDQVQVKISQAMASGENSIKINLHPAELGAVDVNMDTDHDGNTKIRIIADKADTLQLLKQDSTHLVKSLSEIGVKADAGSLQFSLRGDPQNQQNYAQGQTGNMGDNQQNTQQQAAAATATYSRFSNLNDQDLTLSVQNQGLNILV